MKHRPEVDGKPLYRDDNHLSRHGANLLSAAIAKLISQIALEPDA